MNGDWLGLAGRRAVVTGGAGGIGAATARGLVAAGARVAILERDEPRAVEAAMALGEGAMGIGCDVGDEAAVRAAAATVDERWGGADILVNNAGVLRPGGLDVLSIADWETMLRINLTGYLTCAQHFGRGMLARGDGAVVHVASIAASEPQPFSGAYSAGKAAIAMMSRQLAFEWGPRGVRSNCVSPGLVRTPLSEPFYQAPGIAEKREALVPLRRIGRPEDIAEAILFLASPRASYISGQDIVVDGGLSQVLMSQVPRPGYGN